MSNYCSLEIEIYFLLPCGKVSKSLNNTIREQLHPLAWNDFSQVSRPLEDALTQDRNGLSADVDDLLRRRDIL